MPNDYATILTLCQVGVVLALVITASIYIFVGAHQAQTSIVFYLMLLGVLWTVALSTVIHHMNEPVVEAQLCPQPSYSACEQEPQP